MNSEVFLYSNFTENISTVETFLKNFLVIVRKSYKNVFPLLTLEFGS